MLGVDDVSPKGCTYMKTKPSCLLLLKHTTSYSFILMFTFPYTCNLEEQYKFYSGSLTMLHKHSHMALQVFDHFYSNNKMIWTC